MSSSSVANDVPATCLSPANVVPAICLSDVSVSYNGDVWALQDLSLTVTAGQRWVVLGPNGCGKSTLVQVITGWNHASRGDVALLGARLGHGVDWRRHRQRIGVVSAAFAKMFRPDICARDIVMTAVHAALEPWWHEYSTEDRDRAQGLLDEAGFGYLGDRPFGNLSEGERQQVQLARTLMGDSELLVLDEPAAGLDLGARERFVSRLATLAADPKTAPIVLVTHHVEEIPPAFTHALLLKAGRQVAQGQIHDVLTSELVSETFGLQVNVVAEDGRFACRFS